MDLAALTVQLAREAGVDPGSIAASLARHPSTARLAPLVARAASSSAPAALTRHAPSTPARRSSTPASTSASGGGAGGDGPGGIIAWAQAPIVWLPVPWGKGSKVGLSPLALVAIYLLWEKYQDGAAKG